MQLVCKQSLLPFRRVAIGGFSLLEVLIACLIGAIIFVALFQGISEGNYILQRERESLRASQILVARIESVRLCAWGDANQATQLFNTNIVPPVFSDSFYPVGLGGFPSNGVVYNGMIDITTNFTFNNSTNGAAPQTPSYAGAMAQVTVTVTWTDNHNGTSTMFERSMKTYVAANGIQNYIVENNN